MKFFCIVITFITATYLNANKTKSAKAIARELKTELTNMESEYQKDNSLKPVIYTHSDHSSFYLDTFKIRIRPFASFKIPGIVSVRVRPRFAFIWGRNPPQGWEKYHK